MKSKKVREASSCVTALLIGILVWLGGCGEGFVSEITMEQSALICKEDVERDNRVSVLQNEVSGALVQLRSGDVIGSGVLWKVSGDRLVVATAAHILAMGNGNVEVTFSDGWSTTVSEYRVTNQDLVFLFVELQGISQGQLEQYKLVNADEEGSVELQRGDDIILMGSATGVAADAYEGEVTEPWIYVEDFGEHMIVVRADAEVGMSGGGLFDEEGRFWGILCGKSADREAAVLPVSVIRALSTSLEELY